MSEIELKPCPFCGHRLQRSDAFSTRTATCMIHDGDECILAGTRVYLSGREEAAERVAKWNARSCLLDKPEAPDLLEAARFLVAMMGDDVRSYVAEAVKDAGAAIAKAEGRS